MGRRDANQVSGAVIRAAIKVHSALGPGLLESAYHACLGYELQRQGLQRRAEVSMPITYDGVRIDLAYRLDLLVEDLVVVEVKARTKVLSIHQAQLLSYLKLGGYPVGLLINFHVPYLRDGIKRLVNGLDPGTVSPLPPRSPRSPR